MKQTKPVYANKYQILFSVSASVEEDVSMSFIKQDAMMMNGEAEI
jgi:hypothetical protein